MTKVAKFFAEIQWNIDCNLETVRGWPRSTKKIAINCLGAAFVITMALTGWYLGGLQYPPLP